MTVVIRTSLADVAMMNVQRRIPLSDQIAFLVAPDLFSAWCGLRHNAGSTCCDAVAPPVVVRNARLQVLGLSEIDRSVVAVGELLQEGIVACHRSDGARVCGLIEEVVDIFLPDFPTSWIVDIKVASVRVRTYCLGLGPVVQSACHCP